jgi:hypothetical protein
VTRTRTTKKLAQRIDLNYFKRPSRYKRVKFWLSLLLPLSAVAWIAWHSFSNDSRAYSSGRMSSAHAVLEKECTTCHVPQADTFTAKAVASACLACHDGPIHHANQTQTLECAMCHAEHRGRINISAVGNRVCAECHGNLKTTDRAPHVAAHIRSFNADHPQFASLHQGVQDPASLRLNHAIHMQPIRRGPNGPIMQLECRDCHRPASVSASWPYADANYSAARPSYSNENAILPIIASTISPRAPATGRELMAPVKFGTACAACHLLTFERRFDDGVPHDRPEVVHTFLVKRFRTYIAAHPSEVRVVRDPKRDLSGKPIPPEVRVLTPEQWVRERTAEAENLLWRKTCKQCHTLVPAPNQAQTQGASPSLLSLLPKIAPSNVIARWMPHATFDHDAHRGFACLSCHEKALKSTESSDVLLPGISTCRTCHAPGPDHAESRCFECHTYHDWSKRREVTPKFTLPALQTGGR